MEKRSKQADGQCVPLFFFYSAIYTLFTLYGCYLRIWDWPNIQHSSLLFSRQISGLHPLRGQSVRISFFVKVELWPALPMESEKVLGCVYYAAESRNLNDEVQWWGQKRGFVTVQREIYGWAVRLFLWFGRWVPQFVIWSCTIWKSGYGSLLRESFYSLKCEIKIPIHLAAQILC